MRLDLTRSLPNSQLLLTTRHSPDSPSAIAPPPICAASVEESSNASSTPCPRGHTRCRVEGTTTSPTSSTLTNSSQSILHHPTNADHHHQQIPHTAAHGDDPLSPLSPHARLLLPLNHIPTKTSTAISHIHSHIHTRSPINTDTDSIVLGISDARRTKEDLQPVEESAEAEAWLPLAHQGQQGPADLKKKAVEGQEVSELVECVLQCPVDGGPG